MKLSNVFQQIVIHPILIGIYPLLFFYSHNQSELRPGVLVTPLSIALLIVFLTWSLLYPFYRSARKSGLLASVALLLFYSFGVLLSLLKRVPLFNPATAVFILYGVAILLVLWFLSKKDHYLHTATNFATIVVLVLIGLVLTHTVPYEFGKYQQRVAKKKIVISDQNHIQRENELVERSVYFIILDSYARNDVLMKNYNFDNAQFTQFLENKGFQVVPQSTTNYTYTHMVLSSALNMEYHDKLLIEQGTERAVIEPLLISKFHNNTVSDVFKSEGYKVINLASGWGPTEMLESADINIQPTSSFSLFGTPIDLNDFNLNFLHTTALSPFIRESLNDVLRNKMLYNFKRLEGIPYMRGKKFVVAHFLLPHQPFLFDKDGNEAAETGNELGNLEDIPKIRKLYIDQLQFANTKVESAVEKILERSRVTPIIIVMSDHGPLEPGLIGYPKEPPETLIQERMSNFAAFHLPDEGSRLLYDSITPVNTFRLIFSHYFGKDYELLEDKNYFSWADEYYKLYNVTEQSQGKK
jgi:hypothetical protein